MNHQHCSSEGCLRSAGAGWVCPSTDRSRKVLEWVPLSSHPAARRSIATEQKKSPDAMQRRRIKFLKSDKNLRPVHPAIADKQGSQTHAKKEKFTRLRNSRDHTNPVARLANKHVNRDCAA